MSSYDRNLLAEAIKLTSAQPKGYRPNRLEQPAEAANAGNSSEKMLDSESSPKPKVSFWRTRKGIITAVVLGFVVGAVVGGAVVGGTVDATVGHKSSNDNGVVESLATSPTSTSVVGPGIASVYSSTTTTPDTTTTSVSPTTSTAAINLTA